MRKNIIMIITASLGLAYALGISMLIPVSSDGINLSPVSSAWAGPTCDADGDGFDNDNRKCGGTDTDDNDPCVPDPNAVACNLGGGNDGHFTLNTIRAGYFNGSATEAMDCFDALVACQDGTSTDAGCLYDPPAPAACFGAGSHQLQMDAASPYDGPYPISGGVQHHPWTDSVYGIDFDNWLNNTLTEAPRPCRATSVNGLTGGRYECFATAGNEPWPHGGMVSIPLVGTNWANIGQSKNGRPIGNPKYCELLNAWSELKFGATRYGIYFTDGCDETSCDMNIFTPSYSGTSPNQGVVLLHPFHDLGGGLSDVGILSVDGYADAGGLVFPEFPELNVFMSPQVLPISRFLASFNDVKNGALLATCEAFVEDIWFVTAPNTTPVFP